MLQSSPMTANTGGRLDQNAAKHPDKAAFIFMTAPGQWETHTYQRLLTDSNALARGLSRLGLHPGLRAALMMPPSPEFFALAFALVRSGIVPILVDPAIGFRNVTKCFQESMPEIFFGSPLVHLLRYLYGWGRESVKTNVTTGSWGGIPLHKLGSTSHTSPFRPFAPALDTEAAIIYTSGSTGLPKGAVYTHGNFTAQIEMLADTFNIHSDEIDLPAFPLFALIDCLIGLTAIVPDMRFPRPANTDPRHMTNAIRKFGVQNLFASPIVLDRLAKFGAPQSLKLPSLKRVITAGAPAPVQVLEQFSQLLPDDAQLFGVYGATETLPVTVINSLDILTETRHKTNRGAGVCIGKPVEGACVRVICIRDTPILEWDSLLELPAGEIGEIVVKGQAVTENYVGRADANHLAKIRDEDGCIHRMGDLGYFDDQGRLWYCGRKSHRVITPEGTLFSEQIEGIFNAHPLVYRTALVGIEKTDLTEPVLWVQLEPQARVTDQARVRSELLALGSAHPQASKIKTILFHPSFPTDVRHNSKIIREKLTTLARRRQ